MQQMKKTRNGLTVGERVVMDCLAHKRPVEWAADRHGMSVKQVREILAGATPGEAKALVARALKMQMRRKYRAMGPVALRSLKAILALSPQEEICLKDGVPTGRFRVDGALVRVQKEIAEAVLETVGAKKAKKGGGIQVNTQVNAGRGRSDQPADPAEILEACRLEHDEKQPLLITQESENGQEA